MDRTRRVGSLPVGVTRCDERGVHAGSVPGMRRRASRLAGDQLRRHAAGEPLANVVSGGY